MWNPAARLPLLLGAAFFLSGAASLMYQVVWQRLLTVYYGVGPVSVTLIVSLYMLGLGFGALLGGALADRVRSPIALYVPIELGLGCFGLASLPLLAFLGEATAGSPHQVALLYMAAFLCIPTVLMGMTLPLLVKAFSGWLWSYLDTVGYLYFVNTLGAAVGALVTSYGIISFSGLDSAIHVAAGVNFLLAVLIVWMGRIPAPAAPAEPPPPSPGQGALGSWAYPLVFATGFLALGYEIVWFRIVELLVKASPYAFSTVLAVYLLGIALGCLGMGRYLRRRPGIDGPSVFFALQLAIGAGVLGIVGAYYALTRFTLVGVFTAASFRVTLHPPQHLPDPDSSRGLLDLFSALDILLWPAVFVLLPTILIGAGFPLISALALTRRQEGRTTGRIYFFNTLGNVVGSVLTGFVVLPTLGTERTLLVYGSAQLLFGLLVTRWAQRPVSPTARVAVVGGALAVAWAVFPGPGALVAAIHVPPGDGFTLHQEEGVEGVVVTWEKGELVRNAINGLAHGGRPGHAFHRETLEALRYAPGVEDVLVIGLGTGSVLETVQKLPDVRRITLVELNETLLRNLQKMALFREMLADPRVTLVVDDGRRFLVRTEERYDLVLIDPLRTTTAYSNNLYSREAFEAVRDRLRPSGIFMVWMDEFDVLPRTLGAAFPHLRVYNYFSLASTGPFEVHGDWAERALDGFPAPDREKILAVDQRYVGDETDLAAQTDGPINEDRRPVCEYYLGLAGRGPP